MSSQTSEISTVNISGKKFPLKSINGRRCLTKCYSKGVSYLHPTILTGIKDSIYNTCAIDPFYSREILSETEPSYEKGVGLQFIDKCRIEDNKIYQPPNELESILLSYYFNPNDFLVNIYGLHSFDQVIYWTLENDYLPFDTIKRVHNCSWKAYGNKIEAISGTVLDYYYDMAKNRWLYDYVRVIQNKYSFNLVSEKTDVSDAIGEIYKIVSSKFFDYDFFATALKRYVYQYQDEWESIDSHYKKIKYFIFQQLVEHIEQELRNANIESE